EYPINRFAMETKRLFDVLDRQLLNTEYVAGDSYTIADMACWPWFANICLYNQYEASEFLDVQSYTHVQRWAKAIAQRPAVIRGRKVNRTFGALEDQLHERHDANDFNTKTQDKLAPKEQ
ncbi:MAG: glutathione binding-like protein, partial [Burkholderiaceae bacterium]